MAPNHSVNVNITFRNTEATEALKNYASEKLTNCLQKFIHHDTETRLVLTVEKNRHIAEVAFRVDGADFSCREESDDLYSSLDSLANVLAGQLRRHKEKLTKHH